MARTHLRAYQQQPERVRLTAICDCVPDLAGEYAVTVGGATVYTDFDRMLAEADIEAVDICTPHALHAQPAICAALAGKHVLVEKPMANSLAECREMVAAAEKAGVTLMVAQMQRYDPTYRGVKRIVDSGELGPIRAVRFDAMQNGPDALKRNSWLLDGAIAGGGIVHSVLVHRIDLMRYLVGEVTRVTAVTRMLHPAFRNGAEDYAVAILEFAGGAIGEMFGTYSGFRMPYGEGFMIFGDDGLVHAIQPGMYRAPAMVASRRRVAQMQQFGDMYKGFEPVADDLDSLPTPDAFVNEVLHFADCCRSGAEPLSSGRDNLNTLKIVFGVYESARRGEPVDLAEL